MTTPIEPNCFTRKCRHFNNFIRGKFRCTAYPDGIPIDIVEGRDLHMTSRPGDHGITFQKEKIRNKG